MLDDRRSTVLRAIVEEYVATAQPVGSATVGAVAGLGVSAATIRNDMAYLEQEGYVVQPHTSAGRIPSDSGYRYFVDHHATCGALTRSDRSAITSFFSNADVEFEHLLHETARLLARMTLLAALAVPPHLEDSTLLSMHLTRLDARRLLAVLVTRGGRVAKVAIEAERDLAVEEVGAANQVLADMLVGSRHWLDPGPPPDVEDDEVAAIVRLVLDTLGDAGRSAEELFIGGVASLADGFDELDDTRDLLGFLESRHGVIDVLEGVFDMADEDIQVRIGSEIPTLELRRAAVLIAPYRAAGALGVLALVGPTRMNYSRAMSALASVSGELDHVLSA